MIVHDNGSERFVNWSRKGTLQRKFSVCVLLLVKPPWYRSKKRKNKNKNNTWIPDANQRIWTEKSVVDLNLPLNYSNAYR